MILEGESHPAVVALARTATGKWPFGASHIRQNPARKGLERNVIEAWPDADAHSPNGTLPHLSF